MKDNKKNKEYTIERLKVDLEASYYVFFELSQFQRKFRKYFKFSILSSTTFFIHLKATKHGLRIDILENNYFKIQSTKSIHTYEFTAITSRELLEKIIKHNLL